MMSEPELLAAYGMAPDAVDRALAEARRTIVEAGVRRDALDLIARCKQMAADINKRFPGAMVTWEELSGMKVTTAGPEVRP